MGSTAVRVVILLSACQIAVCFQEPENLFERFHTHMKTEHRRLPDYVCTQTVDRFNRSTPDDPWRKVDTLRFDVALVGDQEHYGKPGTGRFFEQSLVDVVRSGVVSTGKFGLMARQVLDISTAKYRYRGLSERDGMQAHEYEFDVGPEHSSYRLRSGKLDLPVGFQGSFWFKEDTLDLLRIEMQAYDIPSALGLSEANTTLIYARVRIDDTPLLLPVSGEVTVTTSDGLENLNRTKINGCRRYQTESNIRFAGDVETKEAPVASKESHEPELPAGTLMELTLDEAIDPTTTTVGQPIKARAAKDIKDGERVLVARGSVVRGELVHLEKQTAPFAMYEVGLEFHTLDLQGRTINFVATMEEAGPAAGLIQQSKRLEPTFTKRGPARMDVLVRKVQRGKGFLQWDARRGSIPQGLKMRWKVVM